MGETVSLLWMSSFTATDPTILLLPKGRITFTIRGKDLNYCPTCRIPIETGKVGIFLLKGRIGCVVRKNG